MTAEQISELKKALSEPIPSDEGNYREWQIKDAVEFVREQFNISYSESRMRQIIKDLGLKRAASKPEPRKVK